VKPCCKVPCKSIKKFEEATERWMIISVWLISAFTLISTIMILIKVLLNPIFGVMGLFSILYLIMVAVVIRNWVDYKSQSVGHKLIIWGSASVAIITLPYLHMLDWIDIDKYVDKFFNRHKPYALKN